MFTKILLPLIFLVSFGCSSLRRTVLTSALVSGAIGGIGGAIFSPDKESQNKNAFIFSLIGAGLGAMGGYLIHDKPNNQQELKNMLLDEELTKTEEIPLFDFSPELQKIKPSINIRPTKKYEVPLEKLPEELKGKAKKQFVLEYISEPRTIQIGNRTIQIDSFKAWENLYEE